MSHRRAITHLKKCDLRLAAVIAKVGPCRFQPGGYPTHFEALVRAIVYQQISGKAAATIYARLQAIYGGRPPLPSELLDTSTSELRKAGLSGQKSTYVRDLAERIESGALPIQDLEHLKDDDILEALVAVKGIGKWTAQMFLMFQLGRPDILPDGDLGIQKAIARAYELDRMPTPKEVVKIAEPWRPFATVASWYLWRSLDGAAEI